MVNGRVAGGLPPRSERQAHILEAPDLAEFVRRARKVLPPQAALVADPGSGGRRPLVTRVVRYERLAAEWPGVCARIGVDSALPVNNRSQPIPVEVTPAAERAVRELYVEDYALLEGLPA
jgi:hypothetical protein